MKFLLAFILMYATTIKAQSDSVKAAAYNWSDSIQKKNVKDRNVLLNGKTLNLANINIHTSTLAPHKTNHPPIAHNDFEEVVIVKEGLLTVTLDDSTKTLGPNSIALIVAGTVQSFQNLSNQAARYYVIRFISNNLVNITRGKESGGSFIKDYDELAVKKTDKGEARSVFDRPTSMFKRLEIHATTLNPGFISHPPHTHREEELTFMLKGSGDMLVAQTTKKIIAGDVVFAEANVLHGFKNTGNEPSTYYAIKWEN